MNSFFRSLAAQLAVIAAAHGAEVSFDLSKPGASIEPRHITGTCLPIWNNAQLYGEIKKGLDASRYRLFRFPNGSLSNEYHWNGSGAFSAEGVWSCDTAYKPGFLSESRYRGTSKSSYGFVGYSKITDGDTSTFWWSDEYIAESAPYFYIELPIGQPVDSVSILWGEHFAADFDIDFLTILANFYPGPYKLGENCWVTKQRVTDNTQQFYSAALPPASGPARYIRVIARKPAAGAKGVQVKEFYCYNKGQQLTVNVKGYAGNGVGNQTRVVALPTHVGSDSRPATASWVTWHFESFMDYIKTFGESAVPVICVNYGTGTADEAAAWVRYANVVKKYGIRFWQVGNEMDGDWEEGGPVSAKMYAERFLQFAKAMKAADPAIKILGPLASSAEFMAKSSGEFDGMSWVQSFLKYIGDKEKADGVKYCDGIDFHSYPYWANFPAVDGMMQKADFVYDQSDSLKKWTGAYLADPDSAFVMLSEFNSSVVLSDVLMRSANGVFVANMLAGHAEKFGSKAMAVFWDSFEGGDVGAGSFGSLSLFNALPGTMLSSFTKAPSGAYWGLYAVNALWIDPAGANTLVGATFNRKDGIRAYGLKGNGDFRALLLNVSLDTVNVTCTLTGGGTFSGADIFTWGEKQFLWNGRDKNAYAFPNCGPVSRSVSASAIGEIKLSPLSVCVVRYRDETAAAAPPSLVHAAVLNGNLTTGQRLVFCGSASGGGAVRKIEYSFDDAGKFSDTLSSLDGLFDGPFESFVDSVSTASLKSGEHTLYLRVSDAASKTAIDSIPFRATGELRPVVLIDDFQDKDFTPAFPKSKIWYPHAGGANETKITPEIKAGGPGGFYYNADFSIVQPVTPIWPNFIHFNTVFDSSSMIAESGRFFGITFSYSASHSSAAGEFYLHVLNAKVKDYCEFNLPLPKTNGAWKKMTVTWNQILQYNWGVQVGKLETRDVRGLEFRAQSAGTGFLAVDNIAFIGDTGQAIDLPVKPTPGGPVFKGVSVEAKRMNDALVFVVSAPPATPITVSLHSINGKLLETVSGCAKDGKTVVSFSRGRSGKTRAQGLYILTVASSGRPVFRKPLVVAW